MSQKKYYAPILKWKAGEKTALQNLEQKHKTCIVPLLEFVDYIEPTKVINDLNDCFEGPVGLDTIYVDEGDRQYLTSLIEEAKNNNKIIYPILYFKDFPDLANNLYKLSSRIIVRLPVPEDIHGPDNETILNYLSEWKQGKTINLDIMLDLSTIEKPREANLVYTETKNILERKVLGNQTWHQIIIAVSSFPEDISLIPAGENAFFERLDIMLFEKLFQCKTLSEIQNRLVFSDYGVTKFTDTELDFSLLRYGILPKAKYTTKENYWVLKGAKNHLTKTWIKDHKAIALEIYNSPHYYGEEYSFGDSDINERAHDRKGPGNNTNWVAICVNHHIAVVVEELSQIFGTLVYPV